MAIYKGSRYEYSKVDFVQTKAAGNANPIIFYNVPVFNNLSYYEHVYEAGERIDQISTQYYRTPKLWWLIAAANPAINDLYNIPAGTSLKVPRV